MKRGAGQLRLAAAGFDGCCAGEHQPLHRSESASSFTASHSLSPARSLCYCTLRGGPLCVSPRCRLPRQATIALRCAGGRCPGVFPPPAPGLDYDYPNLWDEESGGTRTGTNWHGSSRSVSESWPPWRASGATKRQLSNYGRAAGPVPPSSLRDRPSDRPGRGQKALITRAAGNREGLEQIKTETAPVDSGPGQLAPRRPGWRQGRRWGRSVTALAIGPPRPCQPLRLTAQRGFVGAMLACLLVKQFHHDSNFAPRQRALLEPPCLAPGERRRILSPPLALPPPAQVQGLAMSASLSCRRLHPSFLARRDGGAQKDRGPWEGGAGRGWSVVGIRSLTTAALSSSSFFSSPTQVICFCSCISFGTITFAP